MSTESLVTYQLHTFQFIGIYGKNFREKGGVIRPHSGGENVSGNPKRKGAIRQNVWARYWFARQQAITYS
jgi:hypothetical protein